jgi:hypothetical protein
MSVAPSDAIDDFVSTSYEYDSLGRLDTQIDRNSADTVLASYDYTVRADGKRVGLDESFWFDLDNDNAVDTGEVKSTTYDWDYDAIGRLTDEAITHFDSGISQSEHFEYDLTGNRTSLQQGADSISYEYDANDRMLYEWLDAGDNGSVDQTTAYGYDHTQQTAKTTYAGEVDAGTTSYPAITGRQLFAYNLQGRMSGVINETYAGGSVTARTRTWYDYDQRSFRIRMGFSEEWR